MANYILQEIIALSQLLSPPDVAHDEVIEQNVHSVRNDS